MQGFAGLPPSYRLKPVSRVSDVDSVGLNLTILDFGLRRNDAWGGYNTLHL